jgi:hypothetical protein
VKSKEHKREPCLFQGINHYNIRIDNNLSEIQTQYFTNTSLASPLLHKPTSYLLGSNYLEAHGVGMKTLQFTFAQQTTIVKDTPVLYCAIFHTYYIQRW